MLLQVTSCILGPGPSVPGPHPTSYVHGFLLTLPGVGTGVGGRDGLSPHTSRMPALPLSSGGVHGPLLHKGTWRDG